LLQIPFKSSLNSKDRSIRTIYCLKKGAANPVIGNSDSVIELQEIGDEYSIMTSVPSGFVESNKDFTAFSNFRARIG
jgi:hypothetical protein